MENQGSPINGQCFIAMLNYQRVHVPPKKWLVTSMTFVGMLHKAEAGQLPRRAAGLSGGDPGSCQLGRVGGGQCAAQQGRAGAAELWDFGKGS